MDSFQNMSLSTWQLWSGFVPCFSEDMIHSLKKQHTDIKASSLLTFMDPSWGVHVILTKQILFYFCFCFLRISPKGVSMDRAKKLQTFNTLKWMFSSQPFLQSHYRSESCLRTACLSKKKPQAELKLQLVTLWNYIMDTSIKITYQLFLKEPAWQKNQTSFNFSVPLW